MTPKPRTEYLPLERLVFLPELQLRALPGGALYDEAAVVRYAEVLADGGEFPPLGVVEEAPLSGRGDPRHLVYSGFHRGEAYRRAGRGSAECLVRPGTLQDARLLALSENSRHGLARSPEDCRRVFDALMADAPLLARVLRGERNAHEAIRRATGLSKGVICKYLARAGLRAENGKLVQVAPPPDPDPAARPARVGGEPSDDRPGDPTPDPPARAALPDHLSGKARPGAFAAHRAAAGEVLRALREAAAGLD
ncbi:MAG: hypothetical protein K2X87_33820 [Gemmataceae bacterium]|nr:hypothetical protein [Gemmataceae bacterium]